MAKGSATRDGSKSKAIVDFLAANPSAGAKTVVDELGKQGVSVSVGLVNKVKYSGAKPAGKKKAAKGPRPAAASTGGKRGRPTAGGVNMSDAIRDYMNANPSASRPEIRDALNAQGVKVSTSLVNAVYIRVKAKSGSAGVVAKRGRRPASVSTPKASAGTAGISAQELINAKSLVNQLGGIDRVRQALGLLEQLQ